MSLATFVFHVKCWEVFVLFFNSMFVQISLFLDGSKMLAATYTRRFIASLPCIVASNPWDSAT